jgi:hypothetical protein
VHGTGSAFAGARNQVPVPKLNTGNSNLRRSRRRKPPGKVAVTIGMLIFASCFAAGIAGVVSTIDELTYRAGWAGTTGTLSMVVCETEGSGRDEHTDCNAEFRTGPEAQLTSVSVEGDNTYASDRSYSARLHSDGQTASVVGGKTVAYMLGGRLALLGFVVFIGWLVVAGIIGAVIRRRRGVTWQPGRRAALAPLVTGGVLVAFGIVSAIVGAVLNF